MSKRHRCFLEKLFEQEIQDFDGLISVKNVVRIQEKKRKLEFLR
jgi:transcription antitermination factor NusA-like protein